MSGMLELIREWGFILFCVLTCVFALAGTAGLFRFPDVYTRLQASSLAGTVSTFSALVGALLISSDPGCALRVGVMAFFFMLSSPISTHVIARYAWRSGIDPWFPRKKGS